MHPSIVKPVVATPRSQLKRKHGEIVDLTTNDTDTGNTFNSDQANGATSALPDVQGQQLGADDFNTDDDDDDDDDSMLGDALDEIELNPYHPRTRCSPLPVSSIRQPLLTISQLKARG